MLSSEMPVIDGLELIELLGRGGMSQVFRARQNLLDRDVAVKVLQSATDEASVKRFQREAVFTSKLKHPNIVDTISFGITSTGKPYLVLEYLSGVSLAEKLRTGRLSLTQFREIFIPTLSALSYAHQNGLIHRDIKPGNIMLCADSKNSESTSVKLVDFGIAKIIAAEETSSLTKSGAVIGTPLYMSPEQCLGKELDAKSDLYSLACIMHEALSGQAPYAGDSALAIMQKHSDEKNNIAPLLASVAIPESLSNIISSALSRDPAKRPSSASEFLEKLSRSLDECTSAGIPELKSGHEKETKRSRNFLLLISTVVLVASIILAAIMLIHQQSKQNQAYIEKAVNPKRIVARAANKQESAAEISQDRKQNDEKRARAFIKRSEYEKNPTKSLEHLENAFRLAGRSELVDAMAQKARVLLRLPNRVDDGIEAWNEAIRLRNIRYAEKPARNIRYFVEYRTELAAVYGSIGNHKEEKEFLEKALAEQFPELTDATSNWKDWYKEWRKERVKTVQKLSALYVSQKNFKKAKSVLESELASLLKPFHGTAPADLKEEIESIKASIQELQKSPSQ